MPSYKVKPEQYPSPICAGADEGPKKTYPSVCIPVSKEILAALEVGGDVVVQLKGKVAGLESRESADAKNSWGNRQELRVELRMVDANPVKKGDGADADDGAGEEEAEDSMESAIEKGLGYSKKKDAGDDEGNQA